MGKNDYKLVFYDKANKYKREVTFEKVLYEEAIYKAENWIASNKKYKDKFHKDLEIKLNVIGKNKSYKMKWHEPLFSNGRGYFKGWDFMLDDEVYIEPIPTKTQLTLIIFSYSLFGVLVCSSLFFKVDVTSISFIVMIFFSILVPILKERYLVILTTKKEIIKYNIKIETPYIIIGLFTMISLFIRNPDSEVKTYFWYVLGIGLFWFSKTYLAIARDFYTLHLGKLKG